MRFGDIPVSEDGASNYVKAWCEAHSVRRFLKSFSSISDLEKQQVYSEMYHSLYNNLDSLDGKAGALLNACSILVAIDIFLTQHFLSTTQSIPILVVSSGVLAISAFLACALVVRVHWTAATKLQKETFNEALCQFVLVRNYRTRAYVASWYAMIASIALILIHFLTYISAIKLSV